MGRRRGARRGARQRQRNQTAREAPGGAARTGCRGAQGTRGGPKRPALAAGTGPCAHCPGSR
eukprot:9652674-Lingulodinium_polyedra.AAC.1